VGFIFEIISKGVSDLLKYMHMTTPVVRCLICKTSKTRQTGGKR